MTHNNRKKYYNERTTAGTSGITSDFGVTSYANNTNIATQGKGLDPNPSYTC